MQKGGTTSRGNPGPRGGIRHFLGSHMHPSTLGFKIPLQKRVSDKALKNAGEATQVEFYGGAEQYENQGEYIYSQADAHYFVNQGEYPSPGDPAFSYSPNGVAFEQYAYNWAGEDGQMYYYDPEYDNIEAKTFDYEPDGNIIGEPPSTTVDALNSSPQNELHTEEQSSHNESAPDALIQSNSGTRNLQAPNGD